MHAQDVAPGLRQIDSINAVAFANLQTEPTLSDSLARKALKLSEYHDYTTGRIYALYVSGYVKFLFGEADEAVLAYEEGIALSVTSGDLESEIRGCLNLANVQASQGFVEQALEVRQRAEELARTIADDSLMAIVRRTKAGDLFRLGQIDGAKTELNKADSIHRVLGDTIGVMRCAINRLSILNYESAFETMLAVSAELRPYYSSAKNKALSGDIEAFRAIAFEYLAQTDSADAAYRRAIRLSDQYGNLRESVRVVEYYAQFLDSIDSPEAKEWYARSLALKDSLYDTERTRELAKWQARFRTEEKERELAEVKLEKAESDARSARQRQWLFALAGALLLIAGGALFVVYRNRQREAQRKAKAEIRFRKEMLEATVNAQEEERQRIAKDLHDGLVQTLAALKMGLQSIGRKLRMERDQEDEYTSRVKMLDDAVDEARTISHQMMPRVLLEVGLVPAMDDMLGKTLALTEITYQFEHFGMEGLRFAKSIEIGLYRIAQELVNNIIKHSGATRVDIQLYKTKTHLVLHVEDNGKGFIMKEGADKRGIGLSNIFSRASAVNGEVSYEEGQPKGTVANIRVPLS